MTPEGQASTGLLLLSDGLNISSQLLCAPYSDAACQQQHTLLPLNQQESQIRGQFMSFEHQ
jgi:hypothetical protein